MTVRRVIAGYRYLPLLDKARAIRLSAPPALWQCCTCGVKVLSKDQAGHAAREHGGSCRWVLVIA